MTEKPKRTREKTIWDECKAFERRRAELVASVALHEAKATMARSKMLTLFASTRSEVLLQCGHETVPVSDPCNP